MNVTGTCNCGGVAYSYSGTPDEVGFCHCKACQRQGGSVGSLYVCVNENDISFSEKGTITEYVTVADSGLDVHRHFCGKCGSPIMSLCDGLPGKAFLKSGTFDDISMLNPTVEVWCEEAQPWMPHFVKDRFAKGPDA